VARRRRQRLEALTLLEAAIIVCLTGVVLAVFFPTFIREVRTSKVSEASEELAALHRATAAYFEAPRGTQRHCLPESAGPTPDEPSAEPVRYEFGTEEGSDAATWTSLGYQPARPIRYRYTFIAHVTGCGLSSPAGDEAIVTLRAEGDLDGDGKRSMFEREATARDGALQPIGVLYMLDPVE
jgi:Tfp pilus assembly protein PilE